MAAAAFEKIDPPKPDSDVRGWRACIVALCAFANAWRNIRVVVSNRNALTITDSNVVLELALSSVASAAAPRRPWQPYPSAWKGIGADPHLADRKMRIKLRRGKIGSHTPTNMRGELVMFGDPANLEIEEADAVFTQVYAKVPVSESSLGLGDLAIDRAELKVVEGEDLIGALGGYGSEDLPGYDIATGALPAFVVHPICEVTYWGGALHFDEPGISYYLDLALAVAGQINCESLIRNFIWTRIPAND